MVKSVGLTGDTMAHGTRINGTSYGITGGKCRVGGTAYSISKGRTLVGGTGYDISFAPGTTIIIDGTGDWGTSRFVTINVNGVKQTQNTTLHYDPGVEVTIDLNAGFGGVMINDVYAGELVTRDITGKVCKVYPTTTMITATIE